MPPASNFEPTCATYSSKNLGKMLGRLLSTGEFFPRLLPLPGSTFPSFGSVLREGGTRGAPFIRQERSLMQADCPTRARVPLHSRNSPLAKPRNLHRGERGAQRCIRGTEGARAHGWGTTSHPYMEQVLSPVTWKPFSSSPHTPQWGWDKSRFVISHHNFRNVTNFQSYCDFESQFVFCPSANM